MNIKLDKDISACGFSLEDYFDSSFSLEREEGYGHDQEKQSEGIIFSNIVPLAKGENYILLQLNSENTAFHLILKRGKKNEACILISLYKNEVFQKNFQLGHRVDWQLAGFAPGCYRIDFNRIPALRFEIKG